MCFLNGHSKQRKTEKSVRADKKVYSEKRVQAIVKSHMRITSAPYGESAIQLASYLRLTSK